MKHKFNVVCSACRVLQAPEPRVCFILTQPELYAMMFFKKQLANLC